MEGSLILCISIRRRLQADISRIAIDCGTEDVVWRLYDQFPQALTVLIVLVLCLDRLFLNHCLCHGFSDRRLRSVLVDIFEPAQLGERNRC